MYGPDRPEIYDQIRNVLKELDNQATIRTGDFTLVLNQDSDTKNFQKREKMF